MGAVVVVSKLQTLTSLMHPCSSIAELKWDPLEVGDKDGPPLRSCVDRVTRDLQSLIASPPPGILVIPEQSDVTMVMGVDVLAMRQVLNCALCSPPTVCCPFDHPRLMIIRSTHSSAGRLTRRMRAASSTLSSSVRQTIRRGRRTAAS